MKNVFIILFSLLLASISWSIMETIISNNKPYSFRSWNFTIASFAIMWHIGVIGIGFLTKGFSENEKFARK